MCSQISSPGRSVRFWGCSLFRLSIMARGLKRLSAMETLYLIPGGSKEELRNYTLMWNCAWCRPLGWCRLIGKWWQPAMVNDITVAQSNISSAHMMNVWPTYTRIQTLCLQYWVISKPHCLRGFPFIALCFHGMRKNLLRLNSCMRCVRGQREN